MLNMYLLPWRNAIHQTDFCRRGHCVYETVLLAGKRCFMDFMSLSPEMFEVYFSAEKNKSSAIKRDDLKMIWWLVLFLQQIF